MISGWVIRVVSVTRAKLFGSTYVANSSDKKMDEIVRILSGS